MTDSYSGSIAIYVSNSLQISSDLYSSLYHKVFLCYYLYCLTFIWKGLEIVSLSRSIFSIGWHIIISLPSRVGWSCAILSSWLSRLIIRWCAILTIKSNRVTKTPSDRRWLSDLWEERSLLSRHSYTRSMRTTRVVSMGTDADSEPFHGSNNTLDFPNYNIL